MPSVSDGEGQDEEGSPESGDPGFHIGGGRRGAGGSYKKVMARDKKGSESEPKHHFDPAIAEAIRGLVAATSEEDDPDAVDETQEEIMAYFHTTKPQ